MNTISIPASRIPKIFTSKDQVLDLIKRADDYEETKNLISKLKDIQTTRIPFYLKIAELEEILKWKLRGQYKRQLKIRHRNTEQNVEIITQAAFAVEYEDKSYETELKIKILSTLTGVDIPVASAILTLCFPTLFAVIDFRNWHQIYGEEAKTYYTAKRYIEYLSTIKQLAIKFAVTPQEMDMAIWQLDVEK